MIKCSYPYNSIMIENGNYRVCCVSKPSPYSINKMSISEFMLSDHVQNMRKDFEQGIWPKACNRCRIDESNGIKSLRQDRLEKDERILTSTNLEFFDLRLSNKCNLGCRMCGPQYSSILAEEQGIYKDFNWSKNLIKDIDNFQNLNSLYITGGEPTLVKGNYKIMQKLIDSGQSKNITVTLNTNCTNLPEKFKQAIMKFDKVLVNLSIDATGLVQEYIRWPSQWSYIVKIFKEWLELSNQHSSLSIKLTPVIQILNCLDLENYCKFFENYLDLNEDIKPIALYLPDFLDLSLADEKTWDLVLSQDISSKPIKDLVKNKYDNRRTKKFELDFFAKKRNDFLINQDKFRNIDFEIYKNSFKFLNI